MQKWIEYLGTRTKSDYIISKEEKGSWFLGDWLPPGGKVKISPELVGTFYYAYVAKIISRISKVLNKNKEYFGYERLFKNIVAAFNKKFFNKEKNFYSIGCQGADIFPLTLGIVPEKKLQYVLRHFIKNIMIENKGHLDTGIFGTKFLFDILIEYGFEDVAWTVLNQKTYPSYGYMIKNGATTLWESWENEKCSHNHPMFGSIDAWFYRILVGICPDPEKPGFEKIIIEPHILKNIHWVKASIKTIRGVISVNWEIKNNNFILNIKIPVNTDIDIRTSHIKNKTIKVIREIY